MNGLTDFILCRFFSRAFAFTIALLTFSTEVTGEI